MAPLTHKVHLNEPHLKRTHPPHHPHQTSPSSSLHQIYNQSPPRKGPYAFASWPTMALVKTFPCHDVNISRHRGQDIRNLTQWPGAAIFLFYSKRLVCSEAAVLGSGKSWLYMLGFVGLATRQALAGQHSQECRGMKKSPGGLDFQSKTKKVKPTKALLPNH